MTNDRTRKKVCFFIVICKKRNMEAKAQGSKGWSKKEEPSTSERGKRSCEGANPGVTIESGCESVSSKKAAVAPKKSLQEKFSQSFSPNLEL